jgi:hypothetical protein
VNSREARQILICYRPTDGVPEDPEVAEALAQVSQDDELGRWFAAQLAFHTAIRRRLREIPVPDNLKQRILAGSPSRRVVVAWPLPVWLAAAAVLMLSLGLVLWRSGARGEDSFAAYRLRMAKVALRDYKMDLWTNNLQQIREFLTQHKAQGDYTLTRGLQSLPGMGCAVLRWQDRPVSLVCFDLGGSRTLWLFVTARSSVTGGPPSAQPQFGRMGKLMTAGWTSGDKIYLLGAIGDQEEVLRPYL